MHSDRSFQVSILINKKISISCMHKHPLLTSIKTRGKMSEGVSFNDDYARGVICVGVPFPNNHDRTIKAKMNYNDEQGKLCKRELLGGNSWYSQQAYRALAQAIGR